MGPKTEMQFFNFFTKFYSHQILHFSLVIDCHLKGHRVHILRRASIIQFVLLKYSSVCHIPCGEARQFFFGPLFLFRCFLCQTYEYDMPMGKRSINKKFEFQYTLQLFLEHASYGHVQKKKKVPNFWKSPRKANLGPMLGQHRRCWANIGLRQTQAHLWVEAARFRDLDRHRSTKPTTAS